MKIGDISLGIGLFTRNLAAFSLPDDEKGGSPARTKSQNLHKRASAASWQDRIFYRFLL